MYFFTPETIAKANKRIEDIDPKIGGLLCILHCLTENIEENTNYTIDGEKLRKQLSVVFDKEPRYSYESAKASYIIFAKDWATTFFDNYIKNRIDLLSCAIFFLRRQAFDKEYTQEEVIDLFVKRYNLANLKDSWFINNSKLDLEYNQNDVEDNQVAFYFKMNYTTSFKSILFKNVIQKSAADLKAAGQIQTLYSGSSIHTCFLLSDEPLDQYYIMNNSEQNCNDEENVTTHPQNFVTGISIDLPRNRILFGAPGTGKSYTLNRDKETLLANGGEYERVTFHPDYSYANFVGTYKPVPCVDNNGNDIITYDYVPGPFMRTYVKALKNSRTNTPLPYLLIIEEINRANVAGVFGDIFQLLDRDDEDVSEYAIQASEDIKKYLSKELGGAPNDYSEILIPNNMFIWATMNSADQGVFPMDTAFKRRWDFTYLGIDDSETGIAGKKVILGKGEHRRVVEWNELRKAINEELLTYKVNEDKLMGPYFISKKALPEGDTIDTKTFTRIFKNKVIMYLFDDAAKQKRLTLFGGCAEKDKNQYSKICAAFDSLGVDIFCDSISSKFTDKISEDNEE